MTPVKRRIWFQTSCEVLVDAFVSEGLSARVTLDYRALATRREDRWIWFWIGSHSDYDNLLKRL